MFLEHLEEQWLQEFYRYYNQQYDHNYNFSIQDMISSRILCHSINCINCKEKKNIKYGKIKKYMVQNNCLDLSCSICLEEYKTDNFLKVLDCGHHYCFDCLYEWYINQNKFTCPCCRYPIKNNIYFGTGLTKIYFNLLNNYNLGNAIVERLKKDHDKIFINKGYFEKINQIEIITNNNNHMDISTIKYFIERLRFYRYENVKNYKVLSFRNYFLSKFLPNLSTYIYRFKFILHHKIYKINNNKYNIYRKNTIKKNKLNKIKKIIFDLNKIILILENKNFLLQNCIK
jgi:hypothetical protein